ncbi:hypothetical protein HYV73_01245 [Candidatus Uhrbacteria bacterium]|nr:hypothetical protein [Candidatus Uhrbacteria bacterium]
MRLRPWFFVPVVLATVGFGCPTLRPPSTASTTQTKPSSAGTVVPKAAPPEAIPFKTDPPILSKKHKVAISACPDRFPPLSFLDVDDAVLTVDLKSVPSFIGIPASNGTLDGAQVLTLTHRTLDVQFNCDNSSTTDQNGSFIVTAAMPDGTRRQATVGVEITIEK